MVKQEENTFLAQKKVDLHNFRFLRPGDLVQGTVLEKGVRIMTIDLGPHGIGAVYRGEMQNARDVVRSLKPGDKISGKVIDVNNNDNYIELSLTEADKQKSWEIVQELKEQEEIIKLRATACNKGGLVGDIKGLSAFLPVSQLISGGLDTKGIVQDKAEISSALEKLIGSEFDVRIIDANPRTNKLIVSEKAATEIGTKELVKNYTVGQVVEGIVSGVADFGVFVKFTDNPAVEGLIHVSELSYRIIENPKEIIKIDDVIKAKITEIKDGKISLSLRMLKEDPWLKAGELYKEGQEVDGVVYSIHPYGAIIDLMNEIQGQVHISEFGSTEEMKKHLVLGNEYSFIVESINPSERKLLLKLIK